MEVGAPAMHATPSSEAAMTTMTRFNRLLPKPPDGSRLSCRRPVLLPSVDRRTPATQAPLGGRRPGAPARQPSAAVSCSGLLGGVLVNWRATRPEERSRETIRTCNETWTADSYHLLERSPRSGSCGF